MTLTELRNDEAVERNIDRVTPQEAFVAAFRLIGTQGRYERIEGTDYRMAYYFDVPEGEVHELWLQDGETEPETTVMPTENWVGALSAHAGLIYDPESIDAISDQIEVLAEKGVR